MFFVKEIINILFVDVFNYILRIEEEKFKENNVKLLMIEVYVFEVIRNIEILIMGEVVKRLCVILGILIIFINILVRKKMVYRYFDDKDRCKVYLKLIDDVFKVLIIYDNFYEDMIILLFYDIDIENDEVLLKLLENIIIYFKLKY